MAREGDVEWGYSRNKVKTIPEARWPWRGGEGKGGYGWRWWTRQWWGAGGRRIQSKTGSHPELYHSQLTSAHATVCLAASSMSARLVIEKRIQMCQELKTGGQWQAQYVSPDSSFSSIYLQPTVILVEKFCLASLLPRAFSLLLDVKKIKQPTCEPFWLLSVAFTMGAALPSKFNHVVSGVLGERQSSRSTLGSNKNRTSWKVHPLREQSEVAVGDWGSLMCCDSSNPQLKVPDGT